MDERQGSQEQQSRFRKAAGIAATSILSATLAVLGTLFSAGYLKPHLFVQYSWAVSMLQEADGEANTFVTGLLDLGLEKPHLIKGTTVMWKFASVRDYAVDRGHADYYGLLFVQNSGRGAAKDVRIGIRFNFPPESFVASGSPNTVLQPTTPSSLPNRPPSQVRVVSLDRLPPGDSTMVRLKWSYKKGAQDDSTALFDPKSTYYPALLFITSEESTGSIDKMIPFRDGEQAGLKLFDENGTVFSTNIIPKRVGARISIKPIPVENITVTGFTGVPDNNPSAFHKQQAEYVDEIR